MIEDWFTVTKIADETYAISEYGHWEKVHSFLLIGEREAALIDTGLGIGNIKEVVDSLTDLPITVVTTHVHTDHIGSHQLFSNIAVHEGDADWLRNGIIGLSMEQIRKDLIRDLTKPLPKNFDIEDFSLYQGEPQIILKDGDRLELGNREIEIIHTPGHSPGHIAVLDHRFHFLFTGDLLYVNTPIYAFYPSTNPKDLVDSLFKIANLANVSQVYDSHKQLGLPVSLLNEVREAAEYLRSEDLDHFGTGLHEFPHISILF